MALIRRSSEIRQDRKTSPGFRGVISRILAGTAQGCTDVTLRLLSIKAGGRIPRAEYEYRRIAFMLEGQLTMMDGDGSLHGIGQGDVVIIRPWERHHFQNDSSALARIIFVETPGGN
jgi:quercetin dioxygenase-like cupin family protein